MPVDFNREIEDRLKRVFDPCSVAAGAPLSIYDMGLVERWTLDREGTLRVTLCVTFGACTMFPHFVRGAEETLEGLPDVRRVVVEIDHTIEWSASRMTAYARSFLAARRGARIFGGEAPQPRQWQKMQRVMSVGTGRTPSEPFVQP